MDNTSQIQPPESFANLFRSRAGVLKTPIAEVVARYELCEDLACHLVEQAQTLYHSGNSSEEGILLGFHAALSAEGGPSPQPKRAGSSSAWQSCWSGLHHSCPHCRTKHKTASSACPFYAACSLKSRLCLSVIAHRHGRL